MLLFSVSKKTIDHEAAETKSAPRPRTTESSLMFVRYTDQQLMEEGEVSSRGKRLQHDEQQADVKLDLKPEPAHNPKSIICGGKML